MNKDQVNEIVDNMKSTVEDALLQQQEDNGEDAPEIETE